MSTDSDEDLQDACRHATGHTHHTAIQCDDGKTFDVQKWAAVAVDPRADRFVDDT